MIKEKEKFFSSVAHELRTPLNSILPISKKLKSFLKSQESLRYIQIIINSAHHLANVIEDALDLSRVQNNKFEINYSKTNIRQVLEEIFEIMNF